MEGLPFQSTEEGAEGTADDEGLPKPGDVLLEKYRIERVVGRGASGLVYGAHHLTLDRGVALKILFASPLIDSTVMDRFVREARTSAKIESPHVTRVLDTGNLPGGRPFLVMELLTGEDLASMLLKRGALPVEKAARYILQALEGVSAAHALGIVHRDLKPANLFVSRTEDQDEIVKILDFGISKTPRASRPASVRGGSMLGSPSYMAPEQLVDASAIDARADLWSLAVVLFELVTNKLPFDGDGMGEMLAEILEGTPAPLRALSPSAPEGLERVIERALSKKPADRYQTAGELAAAIAPYAGPDWVSVADRVTAFEARKSGKMRAVNPIKPGAAGAPASTSLPTPKALLPVLMIPSVDITDSTSATVSVASGSNPAQSPRNAARSRSARVRAFGLVASIACAAIVVAGFALTSRPSPLAVPLVSRAQPPPSLKAEPQPATPITEPDAIDPQKRAPDGELRIAPSTSAAKTVAPPASARPGFLRRSD